MRDRIFGARVAVAWLALALAACGGATVAEEGEDPEVVLLSGELGNAFLIAGQPSEVVSRLRVTTSDG